MGVSSNKGSGAMRKSIGVFIHVISPSVAIFKRRTRRLEGVTTRFDNAKLCTPLA